jgi:hypothetical protein
MSPGRSALRRSSIDKRRCTGVGTIPDSTPSSVPRNGRRRAAPVASHFRSGGRPSSPCGPDCPRSAADSSGIAPRNSKETPTEVTPRRSHPDLPIIGLPALLSLVEWNEGRRINSQQGGSSCNDLQANASPPAPDRGEHATTVESALAGTDRRPAGADAPGAQPRRGASTVRSSGRKGGFA